MQGHREDGVEVLSEKQEPSQKAEGCLAVGCRMGWNHRRRRGQETGRLAGKLPQESHHRKTGSWA